MSSQAKKTDSHIAVVKTSSPGVPIYGSNIFSIVNPNTGEEVDRVEGYTNARIAQARENAKVRSSGQ
jgi:hypothetical protein